MRQWRLEIKPWADRRLWFVQARRSGRVVFGVVYDSGDTDAVRMVRRVVATLRAAGVDVSILPAPLPGARDE